MSVTSQPDASPTARPRGAFARTVRNLTLTNGSMAVAALLTSPLQARALGPSGRGDLAAVVIVLGFLPIADFGLSTFAAVESAKGTSRNRLIGAIAPFLIGAGVVLALASPALASLVANGRPEVFWLVLASLVLSPYFLLAQMAGGVVWGLERWRSYAMARLIPPVGSLFVCLTLFATGHLTVISVGTSVITLTLLATLPMFAALRGAGRPVRDRDLARRARSFGLKAWLATIAVATNARLDQILMIRLVAPSELGLYAIAVSVSGVQSAFTAAVAGALMPRVAAGDHGLGARALRVTVLLSLLASGALIVLVPFVVPFAFGDPFREAVPMCQILLVAAVPLGACSVLGALTTAVQRPGYAARGQLIGLAITVPFLLAFVSRTGGEGAAAISLVAYSASALYLADRFRRFIGMGRRELVTPQRADLAALRSLPLVNRLLG